MTVELLKAEGLAKRYPARGAGWRQPLGGMAAVADVSFSVRRGETLGLVGESGSGKTTTARLLLRLEKPDAGRLWFDGEDWLALSGESLRRRRRELQMVFQDPNTSLNPRMTVGDQIAEPLRGERLVGRRERRARVAEQLAGVGLDASAADRFPREFSGGQRQRVALARALVTSPKLLICDEPTSSLDVSVAGQIVNLLLDLRERSALSMIFISHDLLLVRAIADSIAVMYRGRIVEEGPAGEVVSRPLHPYTAILLSAVPDPGAPAGRERIVPRLESSANFQSPSPGCAFAGRCPIARPRCSQERPPLAAPMPESAHRAACFFPGELKEIVAGN
ncbi:MAG TPA: ABC transporter ATP-binding protein [Thermoanaerobaculia bacterium]|nr:ABC transporter ATP-binding protein [Thermoanaerobaculia bacterium]